MSEGCGGYEGAWLHSGLSQAVGLINSAILLDGRDDNVSFNSIK